MDSQPIQTYACLGLRAKDIVMESFPNCLTQPKLHVTSSAIQGSFFNGKLKYWPDFQDEVRQTFRQINWNDYTAPLEFRLLERASENSLNEEHYRTREEISINGRYVQHVLHVMTAVGKELGFEVCFGDWRATGTPEKALDSPEAGSGEEVSRESKKGKLIPDYALMASGDSGPRAVGEGKTPFEQHPFREWVTAARTGDDDDLRRLLGQIANYMHYFHLKLGFVSNYTHTIFLKQEKTMNEAWTLFFSDTISNEAKSQIETDPAQVSVRECMLYLQATALTDWRRDNSMKAEEWVQPPPEKGPGINKLKTSKLAAAYEEKQGQPKDVSKKRKRGTTTSQKQSPGTSRATAEETRNVLSGTRPGPVTRLQVKKSLESQHTAPETQQSDDENVEKGGRGKRRKRGRK